MRKASVVLVLVSLLTPAGAVLNGPIALAVGDITGTIFDNDALALSDVTVTVYDLNETEIATATTDGGGEFAFVGLDDGDYVLKFEKEGYITQYVGSWYTFAESRDNSWVTVPDASHFNEQLQSDAITGTADDNETNIGIEGVTVTAYDLDENVIGTDVTDDIGGYTIAVGGDGAGDYVVKFEMTGYLTQYVGSWYTFAESRDSSAVSVPGASGIDESLSSDAITGTAYDDDSAPLEGVTVTVYDLNENVVADDTTDGSGEYAVHAGASGAGDYVVKFAKTGYRESYYDGGTNGVADLADAAQVSVPGATAIDIELPLTSSQTITFDVLADRLVSASPFTLSASASSGLAVTFSSTTTGVCTVSGTTVTLVTAGTCMIRASQPGNGSWSAAANVDRSFAVTSPPQERDDDDDDSEPVGLPGAVRPDEDPLILVDRAVMIGAGGVVTRAVQLTSGSISVFMAAGVIVAGPQGPSSVIVHPPVPRDDVGPSGFSITTSLGDDVTFDPLISVTLGLPGAEASIRLASPAADAGVRLAEVGSSLYVPVGIAVDGTISCLAGADHEEGITFEITRPGTYALRGPEQPGVIPNTPTASIVAGLHSRWAGQSETALACPGQLVDLTVLIANTGTVSWVHGTAAQVVLGTSGPPGSTADYDAGVLYAPLYGNDRFATTTENAIDPGAIATFSFRLRAPATSGPYRVQVRPVVEGIAWLEDEGIYLELQIR